MTLYYYDEVEIHIGKTKQATPFSIHIGLCFVSLSVVLLKYTHYILLTTQYYG